MPASKHKPITSSPEGSTPQSSTPIAPDQEEFRKSLRRLAVSAVQVLIEQVMREELEQCIGASWGECTPERRGYRNGTYTRESSDLHGSDRGHPRAKTIGKGSSTLRSLSATAAMNRTSHKD
jgi:Transposase, Mutator family